MTTTDAALTTLSRCQRPVVRRRTTTASTSAITSTTALAGAQPRQRDYKINDGSSIALRGLFSTFRNWGNKWVYTLNDGDVPQYSQDWRRPNMAIGSLSLQGSHVFGANTVHWNVAVARSRSLGGSGGASYQWMGDPDIPA